MQGVKEEIQNSKDIDNKAKQNLQNVVQDVQDMAKSAQLQRQKTILDGGESKPMSEQERLENTLAELAKQGRGTAQELETIQTLYNKLAKENK